MKNLEISVLVMNGGYDIIQKGKWKTMLYCDKCQVLSEDGEICPLCGGQKLRPVSRG